MRFLQYIFPHRCGVSLRPTHAYVHLLFLITACLSVVLIITTFYYLLNMPRIPWTASKWKDGDFSILRGQQEIIILRWTKFFKSYFYKSPMIFHKGEKCNHPDFPQTLTKNCRITYDRRYLRRSKAVIFHLWDLVDGIGAGEEMPPHHPPGQIWIYQNHESPASRALGSRNYLKTFNWTMTYRKDSDYYSPYGFIVPVASVNESKFNVTSVRKLSAKKTKLVAWIVSHCITPGRREHFVKRLRKYISVDIFGKCGNHTCHRPHEGCYADVAKEYKFYLSFENSLCVDYVTEKFFNALSFNIVPVVFGGANYSAIAPPGSYINARDFKSPRELANYLKYLDGNLEEYMKYFGWKGKYKVSKNEGKWCGLCQKVIANYKEEENSKKRNVRAKWYKDVQNWWTFYRKGFGKQVPACETFIQKVQNKGN